jgi:carbamoyltransferase
VLTLGLGGSNHDFSACLVEDGRIRVAVEEERLARLKYSIGVSSLFTKSWKYCLDEAGARMADVAHVVADDTLLPGAYFRFRERTTLIRHHLAHAASAFLPSPFEAAAIIVADGAGSLFPGLGVETFTLGTGEGTSITEIAKTYGTGYTTDGHDPSRVYQAGDSDHSIGFLYKAVSRALGFVVHETGDWYITEDGKTMGLAPYGTARLYPAFREHLELLDDGTFRLHLKNGGLLDVVEHALDGLDGDERFRAGADLAWAAQELVETVLVHAASALHRQTGARALCLAGGVALNCVANGKVLAQTAFEDVFVQPASGDNGCAVGCAMYGYHVLAERPRRRADAQRHSYLGRTYDVAPAVTAAAGAGLATRRVGNRAELAARALSRGKFVAWFDGGSEFGPRALGHRSLLADPRDPDTKDTLNAKVKHREWFRPFAPAVLRDHAAEWFELDVESPFMLLVAPVRPEQRARVPSIVHVDGTARVQTVTAEDNGAYHDVVRHFHELTGVPVILNTSLNDRGEPIVETPEEALRLFGSSLVDYLFLEDVVVAHDAAALEDLLGPEPVVVTDRPGRAVVTGAGGFIGGHLVAHLAELGWWVRGVDRVEPAYGPSAAHEFVVADLRDLDAAVGALHGVDEVYALAADMGGMGFISREQAPIYRNNSLISMQSLEAARRNAVRRYFYASSACVYPEFLQEDAAGTALHEALAYPAQPQDSYGWEKLMTEQLCGYYAREAGIDVRVGRFHNVYGPFGTYDGGREKAPAAMCRKVALAPPGGSIDVWGDGRQTRSFCYVADAVDCVYRLMRSEFTEPLNIGSEELVTIDELARLVMRVAGRDDLTITHVPGPEGVRGRNSDNTLARAVLGRVPEIPLAEGIALTYPWVAAQVASARQPVAASAEA